MEEGEPAPSSSLDAEGESGGAVMDLMGRGPAGLASAPACWAPQFSLQVTLFMLTQTLLRTPGMRV